MAHPGLEQRKTCCLRAERSRRPVPPRFMSEDTIRDFRIEKLRKLRELGKDPFLAERFDIDHSATELLETFKEGAKVSFAGRIVSLRIMGKAAFAHLSDGEGKIQVYLRKDDLSETDWECVALLDLGDHLGVTGELFLTKTEEKSIHARTVTPLSKALMAPPLGKKRTARFSTASPTSTSATDTVTST